MAKIKVFYTEGYATWVVKEPIEIDTADYPELEGMNVDEIESYLDENASQMKSTAGEDPDSFSLYDELNEQEDTRVKEYNHETNFKVEISK